MTMQSTELYTSSIDSNVCEYVHDASIVGGSRELIHFTQPTFV